MAALNLQLLAPERASGHRGTGNRAPPPPPPSLPPTCADDLEELGGRVLLGHLLQALVQDCAVLHAAGKTQRQQQAEVGARVR